MMDQARSQPASLDYMETARLGAIDIDLRCCLALNRALLRGLAAASPEARAAIDSALAEELHTVALDDFAGAAAIQAMLSDVRAALRQPVMLAG